MRHQSFDALNLNTKACVVYVVLVIKAKNMVVICLHVFLAIAYLCWQDFCCQRKI